MASREEHAAAVESVIQDMGEVQEILSTATHGCESTMGGLIMVTGAVDLPSAQNAMNLTQAALEKISEAHQALGEAAEELRRYGDGF